MSEINIPINADSNISNTVDKIKQNFKSLRSDLKKSFKKINSDSNSATKKLEKTLKRTNGVKSLSKKFVKLRKDTKRNLRSLNRNVKSKMTKLSRTLKTSLPNPFNALKSGIKTASVAIVGAVGSITASLIGFSNRAQEVRRLSNMLGVSTGVIQKWGFAIEKAGGELDQMKDLFIRTNENMVDALKGNEKFSDMFDELGVDIKNSNGELRETERVVRDVIFQMRNLDTARRTAFSQEFFGGEGGEIVQTISQSGTMEADLKTGARVGLSATALDSFNSMRDSLFVLKSEFTKHISPYMATIANTVTQLSNNMVNLLESMKVPTVQEAADKMVSAISTFAFKTQETLKNVFKKMKENFGLLSLSLISILSNIATSLSGILYNTGVLGAIFKGVQSLMSLIDLGFKQIRLWLPWVSESEKIEIRKDVKETVLIDLNEKLQDDKDKKRELQETLNELSKGTESYNSTVRELRKIGKIVNDRKEKIENIKKFKPGQEEKIQKEIDKLDPKVISYSRKIDKQKEKKKKYGRMGNRAMEKEIEEKIDELKEERMKYLAPLVEKKEMLDNKVKVSDVFSAYSEELLDVIITATSFGAGRVLRGAGNIAKKSKKIRKAIPKSSKRAKAAKRVNAQAKKYGMSAGLLLPIMYDSFNKAKTVNDFRNKLKKEINEGVDEDFGWTKDEWQEILKRFIGKPPEPRDIDIDKGGSGSTGTGGSSDTKLNKNMYPSNFKGFIDDQLDGIKVSSEKVLSEWENLKIKFKENQQFISDVWNQGRQMVSNIAQMALQKDQNELKRYKNKMKQELDMFRGTEREKAEFKKKIDEKIAKQEEKLAKKRQRMDISLALMESAMGITRIWGKYASNPIKAGILTALATAKFATQMAIIKSQDFSMRDGGFVSKDGSINGKARGATPGGDNVTGSLRKGEMVMNSTQQARLLKIADGKSNGGQQVNITVEGSITTENEDDTLDKLEQRINKLNSFGRLSFA